MPDPRVSEAQDDRSALGKRLRERRKALGMTMQEVADGAGLSVGFISQIERGLTAPSLSSLVAVARALRAEVGSFLEQPRGDSLATRQDERSVYSVADNALSYERVSAAFPGNVLRSVIIHEPPGHRSEAISHEGEELFYIMSGTITVEVEGETTILNAGDTIHFPSTRTHSTWNHGDRPATILHTCTMDVFGDRDAGPSASAAADSVVVRRNSGSTSDTRTADVHGGAPTERHKNSSSREDKL